MRVLRTVVVMMMMVMMVERVVVVMVVLRESLLCGVMVGMVTMKKAEWYENGSDVGGVVL